MDEEKYQITQNQILFLARFVADMPLGEFIKAIGRAHAVGPIVDPTLYRDGVRNMEQIDKLAKGLRTFQRTVEEVQADVQQQHGG